MLPGGTSNMGGGRERRGQMGRLDSIEISLFMWVWCTLNLKSWVKYPPTGVFRKFKGRILDQMPFSSFDCGSKLRGLSQNTPRVASKRVNVDNKTKG
ncbi:hypothetical protein AVEN_213108-1 [Araneus ventricosus]|uniref:Uncharacterized protein n=1 Tax=Araneus ventricosus TaxID=182803 RepID=A0A4Y2JZG6_ARAVE|nr:hypothetical protein AVEN_213108-1 [Araneus ventricosus]